MFNVSIEQSVLAKALEYLAPTVGKNSNNMGDNCISMRTTGNGSMEMYTTNTIECTALEAIVSMGGDVQEQAPLLDFKRFKSIISSIPASAIVKLEATANDVMISFGNGKRPMHLTGCASTMIPLPNNAFGGVKPINVPTSIMQNALTQACAIISDSSNSPLYNCVRISASSVYIEFTALDILNKRTFVQNSNSVIPNVQAEILVEASKLKKSMKLFEDYCELEFSMDQNIILIQAKDPVGVNQMKTKDMISEIRYYCRRLSGNFPTNIGANFQALPNNFVELNKGEVLECFSRVRAIEDQVSLNAVDFISNGSTVTVYMNSSHGKIDEEIVIENHDAPSFTASFKYPCLIDILKMISSPTFEIAPLPKYPNSYVVRATGDSDVMYTVPSMTTVPVSMSGSGSP